LKLRGGRSYTKAGEQLHIERNSIKHWRDSDEHFEAACEYAREMSVERVEDAMYEAALKVEEKLMCQKPVENGTWVVFLQTFR